MASWVFGYGSLVWRVGFAYVEARAAFVEGFARRFWQGSIDHRGVPGAPGRVVTLVPEPGARCLGMAYRLAPEQEATILRELDHRERGGYERLTLELTFPHHRAEPAAAVAYVATAANPNYLGPASLDAIADQVRAARGPSGPNPEYVLRLAEFLHAHGSRDDHVLALAHLLVDGELQLP